MKNLFRMLGSLMVALLFSSAMLSQSATIVGNYRDVSGNIPNATVSLQVQLVNCSNNTPLVNGNTLLNPVQYSFLSISGTATGIVYGNNIITCGIQRYSLYAVTWLVNGSPASPTVQYRLVEGQTCNISDGSCLPVTFTPPNISNLSGYICGPNQFLSGFKLNFQPICSVLMSGILTYQTLINALGFVPLSPSPSGNQIVIQSNGTSLRVNRLNGIYYADVYADPSQDILVQMNNAYNLCGQLVSEVPTTCYIAVRPKTDNTCYVSTGTFTVTPYPYINPVIDFRGSKICHSGTNGIIDMSSRSGAPNVNPVIIGLSLVVTGTEPFLFKSAAWANLTIRDWTVKQYPINPTNTMNGIWMVGGNQFLLDNLSIGGLLYPIRMDLGSDGYGPNAVTIENSRFTPTATGVSIYAPFAGSGDVISGNTFQGSCTGACTTTQAIYVDYGIGTIIEGNYLELGGPGGGVGHAIYFGPKAQDITLAHNNLGNPAGFSAEVLDESRNSFYFDNKLVGNSNHFVDFGPNISTSFSIPELRSNKIGSGTLVGTKPAGLIVVDQFNVITNGQGLDDQTNPNFMGTDITGRGVRINSLVAPAVGLKIAGTPTKAPVATDGYVCMHNDQTTFFSTTACH